MSLAGYSRADAERAKCHPEEILKAYGTLEEAPAWSTTQSKSLGKDPQPLAALHSICEVLSRESWHSVQQVVDALNGGDLAVSQGLCVVFSANQDTLYLLWRADKEREAHAIFEETEAPDSPCQPLPEVRSHDAEVPQGSCDAEMHPEPKAGSCDAEAVYEEVKTTVVRNRRGSVGFNFWNDRLEVSRLRADADTETMPHLKCLQVGDTLVAVNDVSVLSEGDWEREARDLPQFELTIRRPKYKATHIVDDPQGVHVTEGKDLKSKDVTIIHNRSAVTVVETGC
jgi:hypothetical protein